MRLCVCFVNAFRVVLEGAHFALGARVFGLCVVVHTVTSGCAGEGNLVAGDARFLVNTRPGSVKDLWDFVRFAFSLVLGVIVERKRRFMLSLSGNSSFGSLCLICGLPA